MKKIYKIIVIAVVLSLLGAAALVFAGCSDNKKRGVIIVPGLGASVLMEGDTVLWDGALDITKIVNMLRILPDKDGKRAEIRVPDEDDEKNAVDTGLKNHLQEKLGNKYSVHVFQYDWILSTASAAEKLDAFIKDKGFDEVILLCHSLGGLVADNYLAMGEEQKGRVKMLATYGSPHGGTAVALAALESPKATIDFVLASMPEFAEFAGMLNMDTIAKIVKHVPVIYDMLPNAVKADSPYYEADGQYESFIRIEQADGSYKYLTDFADILDFYKSSSWATQQDGVTLTPLAESYFNMIEKHNTFEGNGRTHITEGVNSHYFYSIADENNRGVTAIGYKLDGTLEFLEGKTYDDTLVHAYSSIPVTDHSKGNIHKFEGLDHGGIFYNIDEGGPMDKTIEIIKKLK